MSKSTSKRADAVLSALVKIEEILEKRDENEVVKEMLRQIDPVTLAKLTSGTVPRWRAEMIFLLTELYDNGYADSATDAVKLR